MYNWSNRISLKSCKTWTKGFHPCEITQWIILALGPQNMCARHDDTSILTKGIEKTLARLGLSWMRNVGWMIRIKKFLFRKWTIKCLNQNKKSRFWSVRRLRPARRHFYFFFLFAMKRCPIAAKIAGSIGILLRCVLNDFFYMGVSEHLPDLWGPLLATILCVQEIWSGSNNRAHTMYHVFHWLAKTN